MRRLITWDLMTLNGSFEGPSPCSLDFHTVVWGEELEAKTQFAIIFGDRFTL